jgi:hypothetical protein
MALYDVTVVHYHTVSIDAADEIEAQELALDMESHGECWEMEIGDISLVDPSEYCFYSDSTGSSYVAYAGFSQPAPVVGRTTLPNGYTTYC